MAYTLPSDHPTGREATQGTRVADCTDWASIQSCSRSSLVGAVDAVHAERSARGVVVREQLREVDAEEEEQDHEGRPDEDSAGGPALDLDRPRSLGEKPQELAVEIAAFGPQRPSQLRREGQAPGGGEALRDLLHAELQPGSFVDLLGVRAQREAQHHVGEVDGLSPWRGTQLGEGDVDDEDFLPSRTIRLAGLMSRWAMPASHRSRMTRSPSSISASFDLGLAQLDRALEELGDQHVLALGRELDEPEGVAAGYARRVPHDAEGVVLLLHELAHGVERLLVLEAAVEELTAELVPTVRPQVRPRIELAEQVVGGRLLDPQTQRRRTRGAAQPHGPDLRDPEPELPFERIADGLAPGSADVQVRRASPPVGDREVLVRHEDPEGDDWERDGDDDGDDDVRGRVDTEVQAGQSDERDETGEGPLPPVPPPTVGHERVERHQRVPVVASICSDGSAQPPQPARKATPKGLGRVAISMSQR